MRLGIFMISLLALVLGLNATPVRGDAFKPGDTFKDCDDCPGMVVVPAGSFLMGSPDAEPERYDDEGPQRTVTIGQNFAVSQYEITRGQFARFVRATGRDMSGGCVVWNSDESKWQRDAARSWRDPGFAQGDDHPVVCVSFDDATAYVQWLAKQTGKAYRLLSEAEWEYAARANTTTSRYWGDGEQQACAHANAGDAALKKKNPGWPHQTFDCDDAYAETAPAGRFNPNSFGLYDMLGNALEWTQDCAHENYRGAPSDGSAWLGGKCRYRVVRGGSWLNRPQLVRSAYRSWVIPVIRINARGFRAARTLP